MSPLVITSTIYHVSQSLCALSTFHTVCQFYFFAMSFSALYNYSLNHSEYPIAD